jgi:hypothetical protein
LLRGVALLCGIALIASQILQNLEHLGWPNVFSGIGLGTVAVPITMAIAVPAMAFCWSQRQRIISIALFAAIVIGFCHTLVVAIERAAYHRDLAAARTSNTTRYGLAEKSYNAAIARVRELERELDNQSQTGCKLRCRAVQELLADARAHAGETQRDFGEIGAMVDQRTSMMDRYGAFAQQVAIWHPIAQPLVIELFALALVGFAFNQRYESVRPLATRHRKVDQAAAKIAQLRKASGGRIGSVRTVAAIIAHSDATTQRALNRETHSRRKVANASKQPVRT